MSILQLRRLLIDLFGDLAPRWSSPSPSTSGAGSEMPEWPRSSPDQKRDRKCELPTDPLRRLSRSSRASLRHSLPPQKPTRRTARQVLTTRGTPRRKRPGQTLSFIRPVRGASAARRYPGGDWGLRKTRRFYPHDSAMSQNMFRAYGERLIMRSCHGRRVISVAFSDWYFA